MIELESKILFTNKKNYNSAKILFPSIKKIGKTSTFYETKYTVYDFGILISEKNALEKKEIVKWKWVIF